MRFEELIKELHKDRDSIIEFCNRFSKIYLYGAGKVGKYMIQYLEDEGIEICGVIVSEDSPQLVHRIIIN